MANNDGQKVSAGNLILITYATITTPKTAEKKPWCIVEYSLQALQSDNATHFGNKTIQAFLPANKYQNIKGVGFYEAAYTEEVRDGQLVKKLADVSFLEGVSI